MDGDGNDDGSDSDGKCDGSGDVRGGTILTVMAVVVMKAEGETRVAVVVMGGEEEKMWWGEVIEEC